MLTPNRRQTPDRPRANHRRKSAAGRLFGRKLKSRRRGSFVPTVFFMVDAAGSLRLWMICLRCDCGDWIRIVSIDLIDRSFRRREDFELAAYAAQSFGVFQEEPVDVVLRFEPEAANEAAGWRFHPTQIIEREFDGALTVRFCAGGAQEMCWHLFKWGNLVSVVEPVELRIKMAKLANDAAAHRN
jgi:hypothetical protein